MTAHWPVPTDADITADLVVIGGGLIGLAVAAHVAERGLSVAMLAVDRPGAASRAAAGLLVPHYDGASGASGVIEFLTAGRDAYPAFVHWVEGRSGLRVPFLDRGAVEVARSDEQRERLWMAAPRDSERLTCDSLAELEPALSANAGGVLHPRDGAVDNLRLTDALAAVVERDARITIVREAAREVRLGHRVATVTGADGTRVHGDRVVLAAGAWTGGIAGLPRSVPVRPLRGQICALRSAPLRRPVLEPDIYMVSRDDDRTLIGSTMEDVGFDAITTPDAIDGLRRSAGAACPTLSQQPVIDAWSGLRPATPDLLPILGPDPDEPRLIYACGHSRNGILLAPLTALVITALALEEEPAWDLSPFSIDRFGGGRMSHTLLHTT